MAGRWCAARGRLPAGAPRRRPPRWLRIAGLPPEYSHARWTPWSVFQDGSWGADAPALARGVRNPRAPGPRRGAPARPVNVRARRRARRPWRARLPRPHVCAGPALAAPGAVSGGRALPKGGSRPPAARARRRRPTLPSRRFQALLHSLFKVLFIFPSRYLFAIGLPPLFSLRRRLPPTWGCIPKQPDSPSARPCSAARRAADGALTLSGAARSRGTSARRGAGRASRGYNPRARAECARGAVPIVGASRFARRYWGNHGYFLFLRLMICLSPAGGLA